MAQRKVSPQPRQLVDDMGNNKRTVAIRLPADEHAFCMARGGMTRTMRRALQEMMEREAGLTLVELQMRTYIEIGALLVADVTALQREYAAAETLQKRTYVRTQFDKLRAEVAKLTHYKPGEG